MVAGPHKKIHALFTRNVGEYRMGFEAGEEVVTLPHAMHSRWLFTHVRDNCRSYTESVTSYLKNVGHGYADMKTQIKQELNRKPYLTKKRGFFVRLLSSDD